MATTTFNPNEIIIEKVRSVEEYDPSSKIMSGRYTQVEEPSLKFTADSTNSILAKTPSSLVPEQYDEVSLTYVGAGLDGEGQINTVTYKLATVS